MNKKFMVVAASCALVTAVNAEVTAEKKAAVAAKPEVAKVVKKDTATVNTSVEAHGDVRESFGLKVYFIDLSGVMSNSDIGVEVSTKLEDQHRQITTALQQSQQEFQRGVVELNNPDKMALMGEEAREAKQQALTKQKVDIELAAQEGQKKLERAMQESTRLVYADVEECVKELALEEQADAIIDVVTGKPVYVNAQKDWSSKVLSRMNQKYASKSKNNAPKAGTALASAKKVENKTGTKTTTVS